ncbi:lyase family protein [Zhihengliuella flava]|uniref:3-carboxy-cis,cis-muconate cycloisomerase n=1 Tax=Zhihengliuella flava TaxID=1285193 RepID=A0A931GLD5_9MICC|nr:lyase family protein [Zhihengliuella flava]MBG6084349.1 3-carboxy-cis,cis-muconate cycloisomerase [Zhihengliuella flava]
MLADFSLLDPVAAGGDAWAHTTDSAYVQALLDVEAAWVATLADAGLAPEGAAEAVTAAAAVGEYDLVCLAERVRGGANVLIPLLGDLRARTRDHARAAGADEEQVQAAAAVVHRGATSQDIMDTAAMLVAQRAGRALVGQVADASAALARLAEEHRGTLCVARSLTQHAVPTTFGLRAAGWLSGVATAADRVRAAVATLPLQWGGAAGTQAALADYLDRERAQITTAELTSALAHRLGLADPGAPWHTQRMTVTGLGAALADVPAAAGKIANDVLFAARPEVGELGEPTGAGRGGSSAMPQKQNPVLAVTLKQAALAAPSSLAQLYTAVGAANDERPDGGWHAEWSALRTLLRTAGGAAEQLAELTAGLRVHPERMRANLELSGALVVSERIMARLAPHARLTHADRAAVTGKAAITELVQTAAATGQPLGALLREAVPREAVTDAELEALLDPADYLGTADSLIDAHLDAYRKLNLHD